MQAQPAAREQAPVAGAVKVLLLPFGLGHKHSRELAAAFKGFREALTQTPQILATRLQRWAAARRLHYTAMALPFAMLCAPGTDTAPKYCCSDVLKFILALARPCQQPERSAGSKDVGISKARPEVARITSTYSYAASGCAHHQHILLRGLRSHASLAHTLARPEVARITSTYSYEPSQEP